MTVKLPSPALITLSTPDNDPVTGEMDATLTYSFAVDPMVEEGELVWFAGGDRQAIDALSVEDAGDSFAITSSGGRTAAVRALDPYDGIMLAPAAGVPQPLEVVKAHVAGSGGMVAQELDAVVAQDNTVVTLMLDTGLGTYLRFSGDWQLLSASSTALDDTYLIPVSASALEVFDRADAARTTLSVFALPRKESSDDGEIEINPDPVGVQTTIPREGGAMIAAGAMIPAVDTIDDLDTAVRFAHTHPQARWYVAKRAVALNASGKVPADWLPRQVVRPF